MKILSLSRLSPEKNIPRLIEFARLLPVGWTLDLYGDGNVELISDLPDNMSYKGFDSNISKRISEYTFLALLSDSEGYPYSVVEALVQRVPVLVTPFEEAFNIVVDGVNGYIVPFDVSKFDFKKLKSVPLPAKFLPLSTEYTWIKYFNKNIKTKITMKKRVRIIGENITFNIGDVVELDARRADRAERAGLAEFVGPDVAVTVQDAEVPSEVPSPAVLESLLQAEPLLPVTTDANNIIVDSETVLGDAIPEEPKKKTRKK